MPPGKEIHFLKQSELLTISEIEAVVRYGAARGINKVRLTGGEPLVRQDLQEIIERISAVDGINDLAITTNGILLSKQAQMLKNAGLHRVNISLDTLDPDRYHQITGCGHIEDVFAGIEAAKIAGLTPIKLNCVVPDFDDPEAKSVKQYAIKHGLMFRTIKQMDMKQGTFWQVKGGEGGDCAHCNRIRLTGNGFLKPCLFSNLAFNIREMGIEEAFKQVLLQKPKSGQRCDNNQFYNIGG